MVSDVEAKCDPAFVAYRTQLCFLCFRLCRHSPVQLMRKKDEQKDPTPTVSPSSSSITGPRHVFPWLVDLVDLYLTNHPRTRNDGVRDPTAAAAADVAASSTDSNCAAVDRWQLHVADVGMVCGLLANLRNLHGAIPSDHIDDLAARQIMAPYVQRYFDLVMRLQQRCASQTNLLTLNAYTCGTLGGIISFMPVPLIHAEWSRLQSMIDFALSVPLVFSTPAEEDAAMQHMTDVKRDRGAACQHALEKQRWVPHDEVANVNEFFAKSEATRRRELRAARAEAVDQL
jgi:hypothetical protein